jgi:hypothetical protein
MGAQDYIVYVVDDDVRMCEALRELFTNSSKPDYAEDGGGVVRRPGANGG